MCPFIRTKNITIVKMGVFYYKLHDACRYNFEVLVMKT